MEDLVSSTCCEQPHAWPARHAQHACPLQLQGMYNAEGNHARCCTTLGGALPTGLVTMMGHPEIRQGLAHAPPQPFPTRQLAWHNHEVNQHAHFSRCALAPSAVPSPSIKPTLDQPQP